MTAPAAGRLPAAGLEARLAAADPAVVVVPPRVLRRVVWSRHPHDVSPLRLLGCHSYVVARDELLAVVDRGELPRDPGGLPDFVILLARPAGSDLAGPAPDVLLRYWRLLFHARVTLELTARRLTAEDLHRRVCRLGRTEWAEARTVLADEDPLYTPADEAAAWARFAALYLELRHFAPSLLPLYFPALDGRADVPALLAQDVADGDLLAQTRPEDAPDIPLPPPAEEPSLDAPAGQPRGLPFFEWEHRLLLRAARKAVRRGNLVRAAVVNLRIAQRGGPDRAKGAFAEAYGNLAALVARLQEAMRLSEAERAQWFAALSPLLRPAADGFWTVAARLLYDLQKVCVDHERGVYVADLLNWAMSLGRTPLRRELPAQGKVLMVRHLRQALRRLPAAGLPAPARQRLALLLQRAVLHAESLVREGFRPPLNDAFDAVDLRAVTRTERVARDKLREELLDTVVNDGILMMGDLRDGLSRNQLRLDDLGGPAEFARGDKLLRLDAVLARKLEGVYRPGEFYLRWLQSFTSLAFGTAVGRWLTRHVVVPFGGAFVALKGVYHGAQEVMHLTGHLAAEHGEGGVRHAARQGFRVFDPVTTPWSVTLLGLFLLLLLNHAGFRGGVVAGCRAALRGLHAALIAWPARIPHWPPVRAVTNSRPFRFFRQYLVKPALLALAVGAALHVGQVAGRVNFPVGLTLFGLGCLFYSTRLGRQIDEVLSDWIVSGWHRLSLQMIPGFFRGTMEFFTWLRNETERYLYSVDEWLRFRRSDRTGVLAAKAVGGAAWSVVSYLFRILLVLSIEPTVNPIKHFPVVTVAGKFLLPVAGAVAFQLQDIVGKGWAGVIFSAIILLVPGVAGFLVWELKENWRLYKANRSPTLGPVRVGRHGETMVRLLRPGFHSGTVPRLFARWRRAEHRGRARSMHRAEDELVHVAESVRHFIEREFVALLDGRGLDLAVARVWPAVTRIEVDVSCRDHPDEPLRLGFDLRSGWLVARVARPGWLDRVPAAEREAVSYALRGLFKLAGAALVEADLRAALPGDDPDYDLRSRFLLAWPTLAPCPCVVYDLGQGESLRPRVIPFALNADWPTLAADRVLFSRQPLTWAEWTRAWEGRPARVADCGVKC